MPRIAAVTAEGTPVDEAAVIARVLAGQVDDFEILVRRHQAALYGFAWRQLADEDRVAEAVQRTFVQAYRSLGKFDGRAAFRTWLLGIAVRECRAVERRARRDAAVSLEQVPEGSLPSDSVPLERQVEPALVRKWIARLPSRQRTVLNLRLFAGLPFREIAAAQGISENAAKVNYFYAVKKLRQWLTERGS